MNAKLLLSLILVAVTVHATELSDSIQEVNDAAVDVSSKTDVLEEDVSTLIDRYRMTNAGKCALMVSGLVSDGMLPITFIPGQIPIAGLQSDVITDIPITMVMAGIASDAAGKTVSSSNVPGGKRFIVVGFNQSSIRAGDVVMLHYDPSVASVGDHAVTLTNFSASDPNGRVVPICVTSGVITK
jgi:hypothetical protein